MQALQQLFTQYWEYLAVQTACKLAIFDHLSTTPSSSDDFAQKHQLAPKSLNDLFHFLAETGYLRSQSGLFECTEKGLLLTDTHPQTLKNACILWGEEHLSAWRNLDYTLRTDRPAFEHLYGQVFFDYIQTEPTKLANYQLAMREYAKTDYANLADLYDFSQHRVLADIGGGLGALLEGLYRKYPHIDYLLVDLPKVLELVQDLPAKIRPQGADFFQPFSFEPVPDGIFLSRVLHDWDDAQAGQILANCGQFLPQNGRLYVLEILQDQRKAYGLSLNMRIMCESYERSGLAYAQLLNQNGFRILHTLPINGLQTMLVCEKI